ncbi:Alpha/Beta hydrolase protein [Schizothecium vesticola]|uniref:Alpha/Beta hydrolase protein n=1 Tax=Schizothecium vesticola TaxID=314040 RepID=A0AA40F4Y1_9PEZI|nr:Alpha/Beta hydrolase protein [Schizothecium vesticola]
MSDQRTLPPSAIAPFTDYTLPSPPNYTGPPLSVRRWQLEGATDPSAPAPFVLHTHGGGFLAGHHYLPPWWLHDGFRKRGYHLLAHSYRLGPQVTVADQLADCLAVLAWCRDVLPGIVAAEEGTPLDGDRYVLVGDSAGGTLAALMAAERGFTPPRALVDVYGLMDFFGVDEKKEGKAPEWKGEFSGEELGRFMMDRNPENTMTVGMAWKEMEEWSEEELSALWGVKVVYDERIRRHAELNVWAQTRMDSIAWMYKGIMHPERFEGKPEGEYKAFVNGLSPLKVMRARKEKGVKGGYPPTAFLHGTGDVSVPVKQSRDFAEVLREMGVDVVECYEEGQGHVWDRKFTDPSVPGWETYIQPIVDFVDQHVGI